MGKGKVEPLEDAPLNLGYAVADVAKSWRSLLDEKMKPLGMSGARWIALICLHDFGPTSQKELAEAIGVEGPTLVRLLDRLEQDGWVKRKVCPTDRRVKMIEIQEKAYAFLDQFISIAQGIKDCITKDIPSKDLMTTLSVLMTLRDRLHELNSSST